MEVQRERRAGPLRALIVSIAMHGTFFACVVLFGTRAQMVLVKPVHFDDYGNPVYDVFIRKVVKNKDGKYWNVPIETYPQVSQFWKYDPVTYMKQPSYSRDFQGIKKS